VVDRNRQLSPVKTNHLPTQSFRRSKRACWFIKELDSQLHQTLDTVLAEAMARDIIHEVYEPWLERVNIKDVLAGSALISVVPSLSARAHSSRYSQFADFQQVQQQCHR
jgi:hypothetical protein